MRLGARGAAASGLAIGLVILGAPAAYAGPVPSEPQVTFDASAPVSGELVSANRVISGTADALEGITAVHFFVVEHRAAGTPVRGNPIAVQDQVTPFTGLHFRFDWTITDNTPAYADVVVVAHSATRSVQAEINGLQVRPSAPPVPTKAAPATAAAPVAAPVAAAPATRRVAARAVKATVPSRPAADAIPADQALAFYSNYGVPTYTIPESLGQAIEPRAVLDLPRHGDRRTLGISLATALLLLLTAGHLHRIATGNTER